MFLGVTARSSRPSLAVAPGLDVSGNGGAHSGPMRVGLARIEELREQIAKAWLVEAILGSPLAEVESMPLGWASEELPELVSDILGAIADPQGPPRLPPEALARAARLAEMRAGSAPAQLARDVSALHTSLLATMREELAGADPNLFLELTERLAAVFGLVTGAAVDALLDRSEGARDSLTGLQRSPQMRRRLDQLIEAARRYGHPFALVLLDIEGPGARDDHEGPGHEAALAIVAAALRESIRIVDEAFRLEDDELCVLAPDQSTEQGVQMAQRLAQMLAALESAGGLRITTSAGVVSCPENGDDPERLLRQADTAMWRARATGQAVTVGGLQDR
jgi:diguanylate cyclase (GGDEF)-like protein